MAGNAFVAARLAAIEKEVAELRKQIVRKPRRARKSTYGVWKGVKFELDEFKTAARELFGASNAK